MRNDNPDGPAHCQRTLQFNATEEISLFDRLRYISLRLMSALRRRLHRSKMEITHGAGTSQILDAADVDQDACETESGPEAKGRNSVKKGDLVEVLSLEEIRETLDENGLCKGLGFLPPMEKYCGQQHRILKKVRTIFHDRLGKMVKVRNTYLLDGVICDGRDTYGHEGCDLSCFFFWKDKWLRTIKE